LKLKFKYLDQIVGSFLLLFFLGLVLAVLAIGRGKEWFTPQNQYRLLSRVSGVAIGTPVLLENKLKIGSVNSIEMTDDDWVEIGIRVKRIYADRIRQDSKAEIRTTPLSGAKIFITIGDRRQTPIQNDGYVQATYEGGLFQNLPVVLADAKETMKQMKSTFKKMNKTMEQLIDPETGVASTLGEYRSLAFDIHHGSNFFGQLLNDDTLFPELLGNVENMTGILDDLQYSAENFKEFTTRLGPLADKLDSSIEQIGDASTNVSGSLGGLKPVIERADDALKEAQRMVDALKGSMLFSGEESPEPNEVGLFR